MRRRARLRRLALRSGWGGRLARAALRLRRRGEAVGAAPRGPGVPLRAPAGPIDWAAAAAAGPFRCYRLLQQALSTGTVGPEAFPAFAVLIPEGAARARVADLLAAGAGTADGRALYGELMRAPAHPGVLYGYLRARSELALRLDDGEDRASLFGWRMASLWYAAVRAFEATGRRRFLELVANTFEEALARRDCVAGRPDDLHGGIGRGWGSARFVPGRYTASITTTGRIAYPVLLFCRLVEADAGLQPAFGSQAARFRDALEDALADLDGDFTAGGATGYYRRPRHDAPEPLNHMAWAGAAFLALHDLTGRSDYRRRAAALAGFLKACLYDDGAGHPIWDYDPAPPGHRGTLPERVWKAQVTLRLPAAAAAAGLAFDQADLRALGGTISANVFLSRGRINTRIDRVAEPFGRYRGKSHGGLGGFIGLLEAEDFCPGLRGRLVEAVAARPRASGWLGSDPAAIGYARLLCPSPEAQGGDD